MSSVVSPFLVQADRFVIGAVISAAAVTVYVLPYEVVVQSLILVGAISSVAFPTLTIMLHKHPEEWRPYFMRWVGIVTFLMLAVCTLLAFSLPLVLSLWIGVNLNSLSITIGQILCIGVLFNSIGSMFYALLHAQGRADLTAKLHLLELPIFLAFLLYFVESHGLIGAAWVWVGRMILDTALLAGLSRNRNA